MALELSLDDLLANLGLDTLLGVHLRVGRPRRDGVREHPVGGVLPRERPRERDHAALRRAVDRVGRAPLHSGPRGDGRPVLDRPKRGDERPVRGLRGGRWLHGGSVLDRAGVQLLVAREDLNHPFVSGNKLYKLKYNLY